MEYIFSKIFKSINNKMFIKEDGGSDSSPSEDEIDIESSPSFPFSFLIK